MIKEYPSQNYRLIEHKKLMRYDTHPNLFHKSLFYVEPLYAILAVWTIEE